MTDTTMAFTNFQSCANIVNTKTSIANVLCVTPFSKLKR